MDPVLTAVLGSMQTDMARVDRVAMNIANAQTPGYKREVAVATSFATRVQAGVHTDLRPGTLKATGQALDFALTGPGWFEVTTPSGTAYTRQGNFRMDANGRLVTQQGFPVMGIGGEIVFAAGTAFADAAGRLFDAPSVGRHGAAPAGQLKVVQFEPGASVERLGDGLVQVHGSPALVAEGAVQVQQGFLENSNVSHMQEMVRLVETVRHLETMQRVALGYDEMLGTAIRKLGDTA
jgi:flagellar basal-body rod protein FlgG